MAIPFIKPLLRTTIFFNCKKNVSLTHLQGEGHFLVQPKFVFLYFFITPAKHFAETNKTQLSIGTERAESATAVAVFSRLYQLSFEKKIVQIFALLSKSSHQFERVPHLSTLILSHVEMGKMNKEL